MRTMIIPFFLALVISILAGCEERPYFKEIVSQKNVSISMRNIKGKNIRFLNVPIEFSLNLNRRDVKDVRIYYTVNHERAMRVRDFMVYNGDTDQKLYAIEDLGYGKYPKSIYIIDRRINLTNARAVELINKYAPEQMLSNLKTEKDTISLVPYKKFREDYPDFIALMREEPDSLELSIGFSKGREEVFGEKIHW